MVKSNNFKAAHLNIWHLTAGIVMALLGVYIWLNPLISLMALALYLGIIFIVVGTGYTIISFSFESGWYLVVGILDILVGIIFAANLGVTAASLPIMFALWCLTVGIIQTVTAYKLYKNYQNWLWTFTAGLLGILFAYLILAYPLLGSYTLSALMGAYIMFYGLVEITEFLVQHKFERFASAGLDDNL